MSIIFSHRSFQKPIAVSPGFWWFSRKTRIPGFRMELEVTPRTKTPLQSAQRKQASHCKLTPISHLSPQYKEKEKKGKKLLGKSPNETPQLQFSPRKITPPKLKAQIFSKEKTQRVASGGSESPKTRRASRKGSSKARTRSRPGSSQLTSLVSRHVGTRLDSGLASNRRGEDVKLTRIQQTHMSGDLFTQ